VHRYYDGEEQHSIDILSCVDRPTADLVSHSTIGLHATANVMAGSDIRIELAGISPRKAAEFPNMLSTAAFLVMKDGWLCAPGVVFPALVSDYELSETLEHILWVSPFPWPDLGSVKVEEGVSVHWLLAVPISESERLLLADRGFHELEALFAGHEVEYYDLRRASVV
jgi:hypothetical protein